MSEAVLEVNGLEAGYGQVAVLRGLDLRVDEGEVVVVLGANGAGKTTTLRAICQSIWTKGSVRIAGREVRGKDTATVVGAGVAHVPQGRGTFNDLTVQDNLEVGAYTRKDRRGIKESMELWYEFFPRLRERHAQRAGSLSGGEQQMLAVARALMSRPKLLLLDEPSLGLAPLISKDLFQHFGSINREQGVTMLVVEQNANLAFSIAQRAYVLEVGRLAASGTVAELRENDAVKRAYLGY
jgi:branched-chain amino acid transport system ATP-binding protein